MQNYLIGANDEHGQNPFTAGKRTPVMPYVNRPFYENEFNRPAKNRFLEACLRCGFDVFDAKPELTDTAISERVNRINKQKLTALVTFGYNAFGSGNKFNSAKGISTFYSQKNIFAQRSKALSEEIFVQLSEGTNQVGRGVSALVDVGVLQNVNCVSTLVEPGYMTNFEEAKLMLDPDFQTEVAESCCRGLCEFLGTTFVPRKPCSLPLLRVGNRNNFVELLQFLLYQNGQNVGVDGIFGVATQRAVLNFQTAQKLTVDGIVGQNTWRTLLTLPPLPTLRLGSNGVYVGYLQQKLTSKLYPTGSADGIFGNATQNAVIAFQQENGLTTDGIVGPQTWEKISVVGGGRKLP